MAEPAQNITPPADPPGAHIPIQGIQVRVKLNELEQFELEPFDPHDWVQALKRWAEGGILADIRHADISFKVPGGAIRLHLLQDDRRPFVGLRAEEQLLGEPLASMPREHLCADDVRDFAHILRSLGRSRRPRSEIHIFGGGRRNPGLSGHHTDWHLCLMSADGVPMIHAWRDPPSSR